MLDPPGLFPYLAAHSETARIFDESMTSKSTADIAAILRAYDFSGFRVIGDVGGGRGHLLSAILETTPQVQGILFDLPHVIEEAKAVASDRLALYPGNFFETKLPACDCYLMMNVIHDWADTEAVAILQAARTAALAEAKLLLLENVLPESSDSSAAFTMDIGMLVSTGGQERTRSEYETLLKAGGWRLERVVLTDTGMGILEAVSE